MQSAATVYSPYDGVVKELVIAEEETAYLEKPLVVFEVEEGTSGGENTNTSPLIHSTHYSTSYTPHNVAPKLNVHTSKIPNVSPSASQIHIVAISSKVSQNVY